MIERLQIKGELPEEVKDRIKDIVDEEIHWQEFENDIKVKRATRELEKEMGGEGCGCINCMHRAMNRARDAYEEYERLHRPPPQDHEEEILTNYALSKIRDEHWDDELEQSMEDWPDDDEGKTYA